MFRALMPSQSPVLLFFFLKICPILTGVYFCIMFIYLVSLLYSLINYSFFFVFLVLLLGKYLYRIVVFIFIYYLLTYFVFLNLQKNSKTKKVSHKCSLLFYFAYWYGLSNLALFLSIHVLNFAP